MLHCWKDWAPLALRLVVGGFLISYGYPMLATAAGHDNIVHMLEQFGVPLAGLVGWAVAGIQTFGGAALIVGFATRLAAGLAAFSVGGPHVLSCWRASRRS
jgi:uncharacterized membrane protein YphA (DoxX/SURF4 family)